MRRRPRSLRLRVRSHARALVVASTLAACGRGTSVIPDAPNAADASSDASTAAPSEPSDGDASADAGSPRDAAITFPHVLPLELQSASDDDAGPTKVTLDLKIGDSSTFRAKLDTGSNGIVALPSFVPSASVKLSPDKRINYTYGGTIKISGVVATAVVIVGDVTTPGPIDFLLADQIGCTDSAPGCAADGANIATYQFPGGFGAVFGVGMRAPATQHAIQSALLQLGTPTSRFMISLGAMDGDHPRSLVLEPDPATVGRFPDMFAFPSGAATILPDVPSYDDTQLPFCINRYCNSGLLDTGGNLQVITSGPQDYDNLGVPRGSDVVPPGTDVTISVHTSASWHYVVGAPPRGGVDRITLKANGNNLGRDAFYRYDVLYDPRAGKLGLAAP